MAICYLYGKMEAVSAFMPDSFAVKDWSRDIWLVAYVGIVPTALGLTANLWVGEQLGSPTSAALSYTKAFFAHLIEAAFLIAAFQLGVAWDLLAASIIAGLAAYLVTPDDKDDPPPKASVVPAPDGHTRHI
ncbi:MAG: hypothetical protein AB7O44_30950 [Hyphomicrobiaceae bacterium]